MRVFSAQFMDVAMTTAQDWFTIQPGSNIPVKLLGLMLNNTSNADLAAGQEEAIPWQIIRGYTASGSGGGTVIPRRIDGGDTASQATVRANDTTIASTGTPLILHSDSFNIQIGLALWFPEQMQWRCSAATADSRLVIRAFRAPTDPINVCGTVYYAEV